MPDKSRKKRAKQSAAKRKGKTRQAVQPVQQTVTAQASEPVITSGPETPAPVQAKKGAAAIEKPAAPNNPFISKELRTIGIIAAVLVVILIILTVTLS